MSRRIADLIGKNVVAYGAGSAFHWFFEIFVQEWGVRPLLVVDQRFAERDVFHGFPASHSLYVIDPKSRRDITIVICVGNRSVCENICADLSALGFSSAFALHEFYDVHAPFPELAASLSAHAHQIQEARSLFSDELSLSIFDGLVAAHTHLVPTQLQSSDAWDQWFPKDLPFFPAFDRYLFAGVDDDNDRLRRLEELDVRHLTLLEPDELCAAAFLRRLRELPQLTSRSVFRQVALWSRDGRMNFHSVNSAANLALRGHETGFGSRIKPEGVSVVETVTIDTLMPEDGYTYISLDIEGAELHALKGAQSAIKFNAPDLGISVYHAPQHLLEVPLYLKSLCPSYKMYLRNYTGFAAETILYASVRA